MSIRNPLPFAVVPEWLVLADVSDRSVRLYAVLVRHADKEGHAHPSRRRLASLVHCSPDSIDRALRELADVGALDIEERAREDGSQTSNDYILRPGGRMDAQGGGRTDAEGPSRTDAAPKNESLYEREPVEREKDLASSGRDRKRDELFEAVMEVSGVDLSEIPDEARGSYNAAVAGLRKVGATPEEVRRRAPQAWFTVTPPALLRHWAELRGGSRRPKPQLTEPCSDCGGREAHREWCPHERALRRAEPEPDPPMVEAEMP